MTKQTSASHPLGSVTGPIGAETVRRTIAAKATADVLLEMIQRLGLTAGDRLPVERELAAQLNVSRSTIREAIRALTSMGILNARQGSGTYITELTAERLATPLLFAVERNATSASALMDVRGMLEVGAAELARVTSPLVLQATTPLLNDATLGGARVSDGLALTGLPALSTAT